jgi:hypothetical protein
MSDVNPFKKGDRVRISPQKRPTPPPRGLRAVSSGAGTVARNPRSDLVCVMWDRSKPGTKNPDAWHFSYFEKVEQPESFDPFVPRSDWPEPASSG